MATLNQKNNPCPKHIPDREIVIGILQIRQNYACFVQGPNCTGQSGQAPHHIIHNTKTNRILYPHLIHHRINLILVCQHCHKDIDILLASASYEEAEHYNDLLASGWEPDFKFLLKGNDNEYL